MFAKFAHRDNEYTKHSVQPTFDRCFENTKRVNKNTSMPANEISCFGWGRTTNAKYRHIATTIPRYRNLESK